MSPELKEFIEKNIDFIDNSNWVELYVTARFTLGKHEPYGRQLIGELTSILISIGINPLSDPEVRGVPRCYAYECDQIGPELKFPSHINSINMQAFTQCRNLETLYLHSEIEEIHMFAFHGCNALETIYVDNPNCVCQSNVFTSCNSLTNIYYKGSKKQFDRNFKHALPSIPNQDIMVECTDETFIISSSII